MRFWKNYWVVVWKNDKHWSTIIVTSLDTPLLLVIKIIKEGTEQIEFHMRIIVVFLKGARATNNVFKSSEAIGIDETLFVHTKEKKFGNDRRFFLYH